MLKNITRQHRRKHIDTRTLNRQVHGWITGNRHDKVFPCPSLILKKPSSLTFPSFLLLLQYRFFITPILMNKPQYLYLNTRDEFFRVDVSKIVYFESDGNYTNIVLNNKLVATISVNLSQMQSILAASLKEGAARFARVGKRHILNLDFVYQISILRQRLVMSDGENFQYQLAISKEALKKLRDMYVSAIASAKPSE